jgi:hypothetical protein
LLDGPEKASKTDTNTPSVKNTPFHDPQRFLQNLTHTTNNRLVLNRLLEGCDPSQPLF